MLVRLIVGLCHEEAMKVGKSGLGWAAELGYKSAGTLRLAPPPSTTGPEHLIALFLPESTEADR